MAEELKPSWGFTISIPQTRWTYPIWVNGGRYGIALEINDDPWGPGLITYWHWGSNKRFWRWWRDAQPCRFA